MEFFDKLFGHNNQDPKKPEEKLEQPEGSFPIDTPDQENQKPDEAFPSSFVDNELKQNQNKEDDNGPISDEDREELVNDFVTENINSVIQELDSMKLTYDNHSEYLEKINELDGLLNNSADNLLENVQDTCYRSLFMAKKKYINCLVDGAYDNLSLGFAKKMYVKYKDAFSDQEMSELQNKFRILTEEFMDDLTSKEEQEIDEMLKN